MKQEELISIDTAIIAKDKGFDWPTPGCYVNPPKWVLSRHGHIQNYNKFAGSMSAPTQSFLQRWLREEHLIHVFISFRPNTKLWDSYANDLRMNGEEYVKHRSLKDFFELQKRQRNGEVPTYDSYEKALEAGLVSGLGLVMAEINK